VPELRNSAYWTLVQWFSTRLGEFAKRAPAAGALVRRVLHFLARLQEQHAANYLACRTARGGNSGCCGDLRARLGSSHAGRYCVTDAVSAVAMVAALACRAGL